MISKEDFIVVHALFEKGYNISEISKLTKLDRKTVRKRLNEVELVPSSRTIIQPSKLEPYKTYILDFIGKSNHRIPYSVIMSDIQAMGYQGGRSILQEFLTKKYQERGLAKDPANLELNHQTLNQYINPWLSNANKRIHGTTNKRPLDLFAEESLSLISYLARDVNPPNKIKQHKGKELPPTIVQKPNLAQYDSLLSGVAA